MKSTRAGVVVVIVAGLWPRSLKHFSLGFDLGTAAVRNSNEQKLINPHENGCGNGSRVFCALFPFFTLFVCVFTVAQSAVSHSPIPPPLCLARGLSTHVCYVFSCLILIIIPGIIIIVAVSHRFLSLYILLYYICKCIGLSFLLWSFLFYMVACSSALVSLSFFDFVQVSFLLFVARARSCCLSFACIMIAVAIVHSRCYCCSHSCCHCRCRCRCCCRAIVHFNPQTG